MRLLQASTVIAFLLVPVAAGASSSLFLQVPDAPGESTAVGFVSQIDARSVTISAAITAGKPIVAPVVVAKALDSSSPKLLEALGTGRIIPGITISASGDRNTTATKAKYSMKSVRVVDYRLVDAVGNASATEQVSFAASNVTIEYTPTDPSTGLPRPSGPIVGTINPAP